MANWFAILLSELFREENLFEQFLKSLAPLISTGALIKKESPITMAYPYTLNLMIAWIGVLSGLLSGATIGLFFHQEAWLGGYNSWRRRMLRLGHISFIGIALLNFAFLYSAAQLPADHSLQVTAVCFAIAQFAMPLTCFLAAVWQPGRYAFPIPVVALLIGTIALIMQGVLR